MPTNNNYQMLRNQRLRDQNTSSVLLANAARPMSGGGLGNPASAQTPAQGIRGPNTNLGRSPVGNGSVMRPGRVNNRPAITQGQSGGGTGWQQGGQAHTAQQANANRFYQPGTTWYNQRGQTGANFPLPGLQPLEQPASEGVAVTQQNASPTQPVGNTPTNDGRVGRQSSALQSGGDAGQQNGGAPQQGQPNNGQQQGGGVDPNTVPVQQYKFGQQPTSWGSLLTLAQTYGYDPSVLSYLSGQGVTFMVSPQGNGTMVRYPGESNFTMFSPNDPRYLKAVSEFGQQQQAPQGPQSPQNVGDFYARYDLSNQPPQMDRGALDRLNATGARRSAMQQGRILRAQQEMAGRSGASADQMAGAMGDTASQFGIASAEEQARNELQFQVQNFQAQLKFADDQFRVAMSIFADAQSDEDRDKAFQHAQAMLQLGEASQRRMMEFQDELAKRISMKDVLGMGLGLGTNLLSAGIGGYMAGNAWGIPMGAARQMTAPAARYGGSSLLSPYGAAYGY